MKTFTCNTSLRPIQRKPVPAIEASLKTQQSKIEWSKIVVTSVLGIVLLLSILKYCKSEALTYSAVIGAESGQTSAINSEIHGINDPTSTQLVTETGFRYPVAQDIGNSVRPIHRGVSMPGVSSHQRIKAQEIQEKMGGELPEEYITE